MLATPGFFWGHKPGDFGPLDLFEVCWAKAGDFFR